MESLSTMQISPVLSLPVAGPGSLGFPSLNCYSYRGAAERGWDAPLSVEQLLAARLKWSCRVFHSGCRLAASIRRGHLSPAAVVRRIARNLAVHDVAGMVLTTEESRAVSNSASTPHCTCNLSRVYPCCILDVLSFRPDTTYGPRRRTEFSWRGHPGSNSLLCLMCQGRHGGRRWTALARGTLLFSMSTFAHGTSISNGKGQLLGCFPIIWCANTEGKGEILGSMFGPPIVGPPIPTGLWPCSVHVQQSRNVCV